MVASNMMNFSQFNPQTAQFSEGVKRAQYGGNAEAFDTAINSATSDPMGQGMRENIAANVASSVMPNVNTTFGGSGMTGSSLHSAAAARAMTNAMAPYELNAANSAMN